MKIAYIVELDAYESSGVLNKIISQVRGWNDLGAESKLFLISKPPGFKTKLVVSAKNKNVSVYFSPFLNFITKLTGSKLIYLNKVFTSFNVHKKVSEFNPDIIYYRWGIWFPGQLFRFKQKKVVVELNTNDLNEFLHYDKLTQSIHYSTRERLLNRADGFCSVTEEISHLVAQKRKPVIVIGNGTITQDFQQRLIPNNKKTQLIFVGSPNCKWHGVDKIFTLAKSLANFDFHIVGPLNKDVYPKLNNIHFHGYLEKESLSLLYKKMDIAIGTLALHRKEMEEASPLKVREYVAYGLPVIVGYQDTDLEGQSFILNIGNHENNVEDNIDRIEQFIKTWTNKSFNLDLSIIDTHHKEKLRLDFFHSVINAI